MSCANLGILAVRFPVDDVKNVTATLKERRWPIDVPVRELKIEPYGKLELLSANSPDGANVQFFERKN